MTWEKRKVFDLPLPSGGTRKVRRPGPELMIAAGRLQRTLKLKVDDSLTPEQAADEFYAGLDDHKEQATYQLAVKAFLACMVNDPSEEKHVVANPKKEKEISPDDVPHADFWVVVNWYNSGCPDITVETEEGVTTVEAVETFPSEQTGRAEHSGDLSLVRDEAVAVLGAA